MHVQQELFRHGGKRRGAGRKPKGVRSGSPHDKRPNVNEQQALHVTLRVVPAVGSMRRRAMYKAVRDASVVVAIRERIRILHISIQRTHIHLLIEAENKRALARGMQGFQISVARIINTALGPDKYRRRRGPVFADRYHLVVITSPYQARNALSYLLNNWRKHREDRRGEARAWMVDPFSSGFSFPDWRELEDKDVMWALPENRKAYEPLIVYRPRSWLMEKGWKLGGAISVWDVPSQRP